VQLIANRIEVRGHPAGPLESKVDEPTRVGEGFEFLGFWFTCKDQKPIVEPSARNFERAGSRIGGFLNRVRSAANGREAERKARELRRHISSWTAAFDQWSNVERFRESVLEDPERTLALRGLGDAGNEQAGEAAALVQSTPPWRWTGWP
jgi:hypothetical protein